MDDKVGLLYVHKGRQREGIAYRLINRLEKEVQTNVLYTEASFTAVPYFKAQGYKVLAEKTKVVRETSIKNVQMYKNLNN